MICQSIMFVMLCMDRAWPFLSPCTMPDGGVAPAIVQAQFGAIIVSEKIVERRDEMITTKTQIQELAGEIILHVSLPVDPKDDSMTQESIRRRLQDFNALNSDAPGKVVLFGSDVVSEEWIAILPRSLELYLKRQVLFAYILRSQHSFSLTKTGYLYLVNRVETLGRLRRWQPRDNIILRNLKPEPIEHDE